MLARSSSSEMRESEGGDLFYKYATIRTCDLDVVLPDRVRLGDPLVGHFKSKRLRDFVLNVHVGVILIVARRSVFRVERGRRRCDDWRACPTCGST